MHSRTITAVALAALGIAASGVTSAQTAADSRTAAADSRNAADGWRLPYQSGFWGHAGASLGRSKLDLPCPAGAACDNTDTGFRAFVGGRFNNTFGLELGVVNFGKFERGGGDTKGWGLDIPLMLGFPIGANSSVFAKAGIVYSRMDVAGNSALVATGKESGWGPRVGLGAQIGLTPNWAIRGDWDRYHVKFPGTKDNVDQLMLGVQYNFR
jgi:opacity protein-like surface antigen